MTNVRVSGEKMIHWVENRNRIYNELVEQGASDAQVRKVYHELMGSKEMTEALLGVTICLRTDGSVLVL